MKDQWHDPNFAREWDQTVLVINPTRAEQLDILISLIADLYQEGSTILDLGIGSGLVEEQLFARRPDAYEVGIESSQPMIDLARSRLSQFEEQYEIIHHDLVDFKNVISPAKTYSIIFSVQALHHLPHDGQRALFRAIFDTLPSGGIFFQLDKIDLDPEHFADLYRAVWNRLERVSKFKSGRSGVEFLQQLQHKEDYPASHEDQLAWLHEAGFEATCLHLHLNRALLVGVKK